MHLIQLIFEIKIASEHNEHQKLRIFSSLTKQCNAYGF